MGNRNNSAMGYVGALKVFTARNRLMHGPASLATAIIANAFYELKKPALREEALAWFLTPVSSDHAEHPYTLEGCCNILSLAGGERIDASVIRQAVLDGRLFKGGKQQRGSMHRIRAKALTRGKTW